MTFTRLFALVLMLSSWTCSAQINRIVVFGDSLSDTGNLAAILAGTPTGNAMLSPPYLDGRVSNGRLAVEFLAVRLGLTPPQPSLRGGDNFAIAGASARRTGDTGDDLIRLSSQVSLHLQREGRSLSANTLYIVMIGGNDVRAARKAPSRSQARLISAQAVRAIRDAINSLTAAGARRFIVSNAPDISRLPETRRAAVAAGLPTLVRETLARTQDFNRILASSLININAVTPAHIVRFNLFPLIGHLTRNAQRLGFDVTNRACFFPDTSNPVYDPYCANGARINRFIFFDPIHPTIKVHRITGNALYNRLPAAWRP